MEKTAKYAIESKQNLSSSSSSSPLLKRVYQDRCTVIHKTLSTIHDHLNIQQLLVLGCGYDVSYSKYGSKVFAVDMPDVIKEAKNAFETSRNVEVMQAPLYIPHNLRDTSGLFSVLSNAGFVESEATVILLEVVMCYMPEADATKLLYELSLRLPHSTVFILDPLIRDLSTQSAVSSSAVDGFAAQLSRGFKQWGHAHPRTGLVDAQLYSDHFRNKLLWRYFHSPRLVDALQMILSPEERRAVTDSGAAFDEFAALSLLRQRYVFCIASHSPSVRAALTQVPFIDKESSIATGSTLNAGYKISSVPWEFADRLVLERIDVFSHGPDLLLTDISSVIETSFQELQTEHSSIRKYVKNSIKSLRQYFKPTKAPSTEDETMSRISLFCLRQADSGPLIGFVALKTHLQSWPKDGRDDENKSNQMCAGEVTNMCVSASYRRKGLAAAMLKEVISESKRRDVRRLDLTVLGHMTAARDLYIKSGFWELSRQTIDGGADGPLELCHMTLEAKQSNS